MVKEKYVTKDEKSPSVGIGHMTVKVGYGKPTKYGDLSQDSPQIGINHLTVNPTTIPDGTVFFSGYSYDKSFYRSPKDNK